MTKFLISFLAMCCVAASSQVTADTTVTVSGTVVMPPCQIVNTNGSFDPVSIDFGDIAIRKIDGAEYTHTVPWMLKCDDRQDKENLYKLRVTGTAIEFDNTAVVTNKDNLGIRFLFNSQPLTIGSDSAEFYQTALIRVVPVQKSGTELEAGPFTASASMLLIIP